MSTTIQVALFKLLTEVTHDSHFFADFENDYRKRLIGQKVVYLLKSRLKRNVQWNFNWYIAGPYSPALAREFFGVAKSADAISSVASTVTYTGSWRSDVEYLKQIADYDHDRIGLDLARWLELVASIDYVARWKGLELGDPKLIDEVLKVKPKFEASQVEEGVSLLGKRG